MSFRRVAAFTAISLIVLPTATFAADSGPITVNPVSCVAPAMNSRVTAQMANPVRTARVYFKATGATEYYVDMQRTLQGDYSAVLPQIEPTTSSFTYRVVTTDASGAQTSSPAMTANASPSCPGASLSAADQRYASNLVLGLAADGQSAVPPGFTCRGIVSVITAKGEMKPNDECRRVLAAAAAPGTAVAGTDAVAGATAGAATAGAAGSGLTAVETGALAAAAIAAGAVIIHNNNNNNLTPQSTARP
jgi:hypothetical protein